MGKKRHTVESIVAMLREVEAFYPVRFANP